MAAAGPSADKASDKPAGPSTLLVPLTPKIDTTIPSDANADSSANSAQDENSPPDTRGKNANNDNGDSFFQDSFGQKLRKAPLTLSAERGKDEEQVNEGVTENTTLKGTIQLTADDTEYDEQTDTFMGTGNAVVTIGGENSKLEADTILYDQTHQTIDARGTVRMLRDGNVTTGAAFRFNVTSDQYLITNPDTEVNGAQIVARKGIGKGGQMAFKDGTLTLPQALFFERSSGFGPASNVDLAVKIAQHPDAYVPEHPSFKFKARKMTYERYKEVGNLTIFGGRIVIGHFSIPIGKFVTTIGKQSRVTFPVSFEIGNNLQMGGTSFGPSFNYGIGRRGLFSWSPMIQIGSKNSYTGTSQSGKIGLGGRVTYESDRTSAHFAYGSVSNLVVADFKHQINGHLRFQAGVNRYLDDGLFGLRRARYLTEFVDYRSINKIPYIASLTFRSSAGWAEDDPQLLNLTPTFAKLFHITTNKDTRAARIQEQISASTYPLISVGDDKYGAKMNFFGGVGLRGYSTGDGMIMGQIGPILDVHLNRVRLMGGYLQSGVKGQSPFVFDQFIQGTRSTFYGGDVKLNNWLTVGGAMGYNLDAKLLTSRSINAAIGPPDFKFVMLYDTIRGLNRYGFDLLFGQPVPFNRLALKNSSDQGQLGGGI